MTGKDTGKDETNKYAKYEKEFQEDKFWDKLAKNFKKISKKTVMRALLLYYAMQHPDCGIKEKAIIIGALGYFILPLDIVPDFTPIFGYIDDFGALGWAIHAVSNLIDDDVRAKADTKASEWFGE